MTELWDDPSRDFRQRYEVPEHFLWDPCELKTIDYIGYVDAALGLLPPAPASVLDVGCGDGWVARETMRHGYEVTGVDYSERAVAFAELLAPGGEFHARDIRRLGESEELHGRFDAALFIEVLEHIPPDYHPDVLRGIRECLVPGGTLVLTVPSVFMPMNRWHYKHFTRNEGASLLREAGFEVRRVVNQRVMSPLWSNGLYRMLSNKVYDLRAARRVLKDVLLNRYNTTDDPQRAGRYIYQSVRA